MKQIFDWLREQMQEEPKRLRKMKNQCIALSDSEVLGIEERAYGFYRQCINEAEAKWNGGWIPCEVELPPMPKENPLFENKPLELYLTTIKGADYPFRAFWNGKYFTDGWGEVEAIAWMPLPPKYEPKDAPYQKGE